MQLIDGTIIVSATDLVGYLACDHLATPRARADRRAAGRSRTTARIPSSMLLQERGDRTRRRTSSAIGRPAGASTRSSNRDAQTPAELRAAEAETLDAMRRGVEVIYQATFFDGRWRGHADFLLRDRAAEPASAAWSYDVADTKLARGVKAGAILQVCVYADRLDRRSRACRRSGSSS